MDTAVISAGGKGGRLYPLTNIIPKPLMPISGKPTIEWILEMLNKHNFKRVFITLGYKADEIKNYLGKSYKGVSITYLTESEPLGTAGAFNLFSSKIKETFLQIHADILIDVNLAEVLAKHQKEKNFVTLVVKTIDDPSPFSSVVIKNNRVRDYVFKPKKEDAPSQVVFTGVSILEPLVFSLVREKKIADFDKDILMPLVHEEKIGAYLYTGPWFPIDTIEKYACANAFWRTPFSAHTSSFEI
ncbi:MAG: nucleotidyltransferase family protein [Nanoarchaeota archaeon]